MDRAEIDTSIRSLIEPFNKKGIEVTDATTQTCALPIFCE